MPSDSRLNVRSFDTQQVSLPVRWGQEVCMSYNCRSSKTAGISYHHPDHLGNIMLAYSDLNGDGYIQPRDEVLEENRYFPYGLKQAPYTKQSTTLPFGYNGAEWKDNLGLHLTTYRTMAPEVALWGQVDLKAELMYGYSPYASMRGNPISYADPDGDIAFVPILVGMAIGAAIHTGGHLIQNQGTFNDWNWAAFAASTVAGGVSGGVGNALNAAQVGGIAGGAVLGASSSAAYGIVRTPLDQNYSVNDAVKGFAIGTLTGAAIGGLDAAFKGQNIWDGSSKVSQQRFITDEGDAIIADRDYYNNDYTTKANEIMAGGEGDLPASRSIEINRGFKGSLEVDVDAFLMSGERYSLQADGVDIFSTTKRFKGPISIPKGTRNISFGITGQRAAQITQQNGIQFGITVVPSTSTQLQGAWRGWSGFLFF